MLRILSRIGHRAGRIRIQSVYLWYRSTNILYRYMTFKLLDQQPLIFLHVFVRSVKYDIYLPDDDVDKMFEVVRVPLNELAWIAVVIFNL